MSLRKDQEKANLVQPTCQDWFVRHWNLSINVLDPVLIRVLPETQLGQHFQPPGSFHLILDWSILHLQNVCRRRVRWRARHSREINTQEHLTSDSTLIGGRLLTGGRLRDYFSSSDCSSDSEVTSIVGCLCNVMSTVDWSWREMSLPRTEERGKRRARVGVSGDCWVHWEAQLNSISQTKCHHEHQWSCSQTHARLARQSLALH